MELNSSVTAVVTGGASGLGKATATALAAQGVKVAIFDKNEESGEAVKRSIGGVFWKANVTSDEDVDAAFDKARAAHGQERILVNCAGTGNAFKTIWRDKTTGEAKYFPLDSFNRIIQINLVRTMRCIAKSARGMIGLEPLVDGERRVIVNTGSVTRVEGQVVQAAYSASKGGVIAMTLPVGRDLMNDGIRVNTILLSKSATTLMRRPKRHHRRRRNDLPDEHRSGGFKLTARFLSNGSRTSQMSGRRALRWAQRACTVPPGPHGGAVRRRCLSSDGVLASGAGVRP